MLTCKLMNEDLKDWFRRGFNLSVDPPGVLAGRSGSSLRESPRWLLFAPKKDSIIRISLSGNRKQPLRFSQWVRLAISMFPNLIFLELPKYDDLWEADFLVVIKRILDNSAKLKRVFYHHNTGICADQPLQLLANGTEPRPPYVGRMVELNLDLQLQRFPDLEVTLKKDRAWTEKMQKALRTKGKAVTS